MVNLFCLPLGVREVEAICCCGCTVTNLF